MKYNKLCLIKFRAKRSIKFTKQFIDDKQNRK